MSADVEGSFAGFFPAAVLPLAAGGGVLDVLPLGAASACALFFFFAMSKAPLGVNGESWGCFVAHPKIRLGVSVENGGLCHLSPNPGRHAQHHH